MLKLYTVHRTERSIIKPLIEKWHYSHPINGLMSEYCFIGHVLRWLKINMKLKHVLSYADSNYNHRGTIYKASNFRYLGLTKPGKIILYKGKMYHDKAIRTKHKGELKPFAKELKSATLNSEATYVRSLPKHIYLYNLRSHCHDNQNKKT